MKRHPPICVEGELVALGPLRRDLLPTYQRWHNDVATLRTYALRLPSTLEQEEALLAELTASGDEAFFTMYEQATGRPIGTTYLTGIDHRQRRAELGILVGEVECRGKGYGSEVTRLMRDFAFTTLGLHRPCSPSPSTTWPAGAPTRRPASARSLGAARAIGWLADSGT